MRNNPNQPSLSPGIEQAVQQFIELDAPDNVIQSLTQIFNGYQQSELLSKMDGDHRLEVYGHFQGIIHLLYMMQAVPEESGYVISKKGILKTRI